MPWLGPVRVVHRPTLLEYLESIPARRDAGLASLRLPVQRVARVMLGNGADGSTHGEFRGYQGTLASGTLRPGDEVMVMPSAQRARVAGIKIGEQSLAQAAMDRSVVVSLDRELDVSRGDMLVDPREPPRVSKELVADLCWLSEQPLQPRGKYLIKHTTRTVQALFAELDYLIDVNTLARHKGPETAHMNDIVRVRLKLQQPLLTDAYADNRVTGSFIVIARVTEYRGGRRDCLTRSQNMPSQSVLLSNQLGSSGQRGRRVHPWHESSS